MRSARTAPSFISVITQRKPPLSRRSVHSSQACHQYDVGNHNAVILKDPIDHKASAATLRPDNKPENKPDSKPDNKATVQHISDDDRKTIVDLLGEPVAQKLIELDENVQAKKPLAPEQRTVTFDPVTDRAKRGTIHQVCYRQSCSALGVRIDKLPGNSPHLPVSH